MNKENLVSGEVYFIVLFDDEELTIPVIQTLIFQKAEVGENSGEQLYLFQEIKPHDKESTFFVRKDDVDTLVLDHNELIAKLKARQQKSG